MATGTATCTVGPVLDGFGTSHDAVVPTSIDSTGVADVTAALLNFITAQPDGSRIMFQPGGVYRCEKPVKIISRSGILFDGRGATIMATVKAPYSDKVNGTGDVFNCVVSTPRWTIGGSAVVTVTAPAGTHPFAALTKPGNIFSWYVTTPQLPGNNARTQFGRVDVTPNIPEPTDSVIHLVTPTTKAWPDGTYAKMSFLSPEDHDRSQLHVEKCTNVKFQNFTVRGANTANGSFDTNFEGQHCFRILGGNGITLENCTAYDSWADCAALFFDFSYVAAKNVTLRNCHLYNAGRHGITVNGLTDAVIEHCDVHDSNRHSIDVEINGSMQKARRIKILSNRFGNAGLGTIAISTGFGVPADIGDFVIDANVCYGSNTGATFQLPIGTQQNSVVPGTGKLAGEIRRWNNFVVTNNVSSPSKQFGTGALPSGWVSGRAYVIGDVVTDTTTAPDTFWQCKLGVTSATAPNADSTHWRSTSIWNNAPAEIKIQYCDNVVVAGNVVNMQSGRLMYAVWADKCTGVVVNDNHDFTPTDDFVSPHHESNIVAFSQGFATLNVGPVLTATGSQATSVQADLNVGPVLTATGSTQIQGTGNIDAGPVFTAVGTSSTVSAQLNVGPVLTATGYDPNLPSGGGLDRAGGIELRGPGWDATGWDSGGWDEGRP